MPNSRFLKLLSVEPDVPRWYWVTYGFGEKTEDNIRIRVRVYVKRETRRLGAIEREAEPEAYRLIRTLLPTKGK